DLYHALETSSRDQLYYQTRVEYLSLSRAERIVEATRASLQRATVIMKDVGSLMAAGAADSVDRLEAELAMTEANLKVQEALTLRRSAEIRLAILLGLPADDSLALTDSLPAPQIPLPRQDSIERAELRAAAASVSLSASQVRLARSAYYPIIAFFGGYSYGKPNLDLFNKNWMDYFIVGASMTWSFDIGRREHYQVLHAKGLRTAAREEREDLTERFGREARLAYEGLTLAYEKYLTAGRRHDMASDNFRLAEQKHREGVLSSNRLLQIETSFSEAEAGLAVALADYHLAQSAYYFAAGSDKLQKGF
ncbi:MAG TPA: TolC family protein, partial [Candidatus Deferrimicrobium sp.]|nr:TolC family protein [Candidatus Deferrimicrobium sp.]